MPAFISVSIHPLVPAGTLISVENIWLKESQISHLFCHTRSEFFVSISPRTLTAVSYYQLPSWVCFVSRATLHLWTKWCMPNNYAGLEALWVYKHLHYNTSSATWPSNWLQGYECHWIFIYKNPMTWALLHAKLVLAVFKSWMLLVEFRSKQSLQKIMENK